MGNILDPCSVIPISFGCITTIAAIAAIQVSGFCLPVLDYVKFVTICILMYFYYEIVIKSRPAVCGNTGGSMWSSICLCVVICAAILAGICMRFNKGDTEGLPGVGDAIGYFLLVFGVLPCTLCCIFRLYFTKGPFNADFWNPATITKIYV